MSHELCLRVRISVSITQFRVEKATIWSRMYQRRIFKLAGDVMTRQVPDKVKYENAEYALIGVKGDGMPHPKDFGMRLVSTFTNNPRGFEATYTITNNTLRLTRLYIDGNLLPNRDGSPASLAMISGIMPEEYINQYGAKWGWVYEDIAHRAQLTGGILIGIGRHPSWYGRSGALPMPYQYQDVLVLDFDGGTLLDIINLSDDVERWRESMEKEESDTWRELAPDRIGIWIEDIFGWYQR